MTDVESPDAGWRPLSKPNPGGGTMPPKVGFNRRLNTDGSPIVTSFVRLARTHAFHAIGDATYAVALVGSIFALDTDAARGRILLYLLLTLAPFALVGPFIGPALDRMAGGRRLMIIGTLAVRAVLMVLLIRNIETFWLFPIAFTQLVMGKTYSVAKAATVPTTVNSDEELVDKNARLAVLGTVAGAVGAAPALGLQAIWGSSPTVVYAFLIYCIGVAAATRLPRVQVDDPAEVDAEVDLRSAGVRLAALIMSVLRGIAGFVFWLMVFAFGNNDIDTDGIGKAAGLAVRHALGFSIEGDNSQPAWKLGFVLASIGLGIFLGNILAPRVRERISEETMIVGALGAILFAAIGAIWAGGLSGAVVLALVVGMAPAIAKLAFDSLVQRDAPGANHGAAFGRFETRFQVASVVGSVIAVAPTVLIPVRAGSLIVAIAALIAGVVYLLGARSMQTGQPLPWAELTDRIRAQAGAMVPGAGDGAAPDAGGQAQPDPAQPSSPAAHRAPPTVQVEAVEPDQAVEQADDPLLVAPAFLDEPVDPPPPPSPVAPSPAAPSAQSQPAAPAADYVPFDIDAQGGADSSPAEWGDWGESDATEIESQSDQPPPPEDPRRAADPYGLAFADRPVEAPDWASAVFDEDPAHDPLMPPQWLDGHDATPADTAESGSTSSDSVATDPDPTPPFGTPQV